MPSRLVALQRSIVSEGFTLKVGGDGISSMIQPRIYGVRESTEGQTLVVFEVIGDLD